MAELPVRPSLEQLRNQAKDLVRAVRSGDRAAAKRLQQNLARARALSIEQILPLPVTLAEAQRVVAREYGLLSWSRLKAHVETVATSQKEATSAFVSAVNGRNVYAARELLQRHEHLRAQIDAPWFSFDSPALVAAAGRKDTAMVEALLDFGADPIARSQWWAGGFSALCLADDQTAELLLSRGAAPDIHDAAHIGDLTRVRELVEADPALVHSRGGDGQSPLHFADTVEVAAYLVDHGADLEFRDIDHESTPAQTVLVTRPEVCRYLLSRGARADLFMAAQLNDVALAQRILEADPGALSARVGVEPFVAASSGAGHVYVYTLRTGESPIALAAMLQHREVLQAMLEHASPLQRLLAAIVGCDEELARRQVEAQPDLMSQLTADEHGIVPEFAWRNRICSVRLALDLGFPVDAIGAEGSTALNRAAIRGYADIVELTLGRGADPGVKNSYGGTALSAALWGAVNFHDPEGDYPATVGWLLARERPWEEIRFPVNVPAVDAVLEEYLKPRASSSLSAALLLNDGGQVARLLAAGADSDTPEEPGEGTPRGVASRLGRMQLLDAG